ncbi:MAG TPA: DoxX family protein [Acidimicrobiales bacterium]
MGRRSKRWASEHLDHLGFPDQLRFVFPIVKASSALGLAVGLRSRAVGRLTAASIVAYFIIGLGFHARAKDAATEYAPAVGMLLWSYLVLRAFGSDASSD